MEGHLSSKRTRAADWPRHGLALNEASGEPWQKLATCSQHERPPRSAPPARRTAPVLGSPWRRRAAEGHPARAGGAPTSGMPEQRPRGGPHSCDGRGALQARATRRCPRPPHSRSRQKLQRARCWRDGCRWIEIVHWRVFQNVTKNTYLVGIAVDTVESPIVFTEFKTHLCPCGVACSCLPFIHKCA